MSAPTPLPPGWYPDPSGKAGMLYWDGQQWHTAPPPVPPSAQKKPGCLPGLVLFLVLFAVLWFLLATCGHSSNTSSPSTTTSARTTPPTPDERYLYILKSNVAGITNTEGDAGLIKLGHAVCGELESGSSRDSIRRHFTQGPGWSDSDASWLITASAVAYCPEFILPSDKWMDPPS